MAEVCRKLRSLLNQRYWYIYDTVKAKNTSRNGVLSLQVGIQV